MPRPQILEDLPFHHRQWFFQRVGWGIAFLVLILAVFGLFGDGPLSHVHAGSPQLRVEYDRFIRRDNPAPLHIEAQPTSGEQVSLAFSASYLQGFRLDSVLPYPEHTYSTATDVVLVFRTTSPGKPVRITILQSAIDPGSMHGQLQLLGAAAGTEIKLDQFVYP
jgi:hypothetical protein